MKMKKKLNWEEYQINRYISDNFGDNYNRQASAERRCELCGKALTNWDRKYLVAVFMWGCVLHLPHSEQMFHALVAAGKIERVEVGAHCHRTLLRLSEEEGFFLQVNR